VPLVIAGPGFETRRVAGPVENVDLFPTLLAVAGLEPDPGASGVDLRAIGPEGKDLVYAYGLRASAVRTREGLKLIVPAAYRIDRGMRPELYDLAADPRERKNLAASRGDDVARLAAAIESWKAAYAGALPREGALPAEMDDRLREAGYVK
jgi:arylsulfatase A-like enzyme